MTILGVGPKNNIIKALALLKHSGIFYSNLTLTLTFISFRIGGHLFQTWIFNMRVTFIRFYNFSFFLCKPRSLFDLELVNIIIFIIMTIFILFISALSFSNPGPDTTTQNLYLVMTLSYLGAMLCSFGSLQYVSYPMQVTPFNRLN